jgi:hypothetical protein
MALTGNGYVPLGPAENEEPSPGAAGTVSSAHKLDDGLDFIRLEKASGWDEDKHPRWEEGTDAGRGGQFRSADNASTGKPAVQTNGEVSVKQPGSSNPGVAVVLPDGSKVPDSHSPTGFMMSPVSDLSPVAAAGRRVRNTYRMISDGADDAGFAAASAYLAASLWLYLHHGGVFDYQREGNQITGFSQLPQFRAVSNFNVGLLSQEAGLTLNETLSITGAYARLFSSNARPDRPYGIDPEMKPFIEQGYATGKAGIFR